ncbi:MAG TPA: CapA family protein [Longimicrobium sp.]|nr:CapA family protein [Longimicrobium sp.]
MTTRTLLLLAGALAAAVPARAQDTIPRAPADTLRPDTLAGPRPPRDTILISPPPLRAAPDSSRAVPSAGVRRDSMRRAAPVVRAPVPRVRPRPTAPLRRPPARIAGGRGRQRGPRVCAGGDVTLGTNLDTTWVFTASARLGRRVAAFPDPDSLLAPLAPLVADADVLMLNVESAIGRGPPSRQKCAPGSTACFAFRTEPASAAALRRLAGAAPLVGNVANNHARDAGVDGWYATMRHLRDAGARVTGADTLATPVPTAWGDTVAFLGFSPWTGPDSRNPASVRRHVARAAARWRYVVVSVHLGAEGRGAQHTYDAPEVFLGEDRGNPVAFAHAAVDAGASVVFGSGPHVLRAAEWYGGGLIFYSLGNLLTYGPFTLSDPLNRGAIACADLDPAGGVAYAELRPTRQSPPGIVRPDSSGAASALVHALGAQDLPYTSARVTSDGVLVRPE